MKKKPTKLKEKLKELEPEALEHMGRRLIEIAVNAFSVAYIAHKHGLTLAAILIDVDITAAGRGQSKAVTYVKRVAAANGVQAADNQVPLDVAICHLREQFEERLQRQLNENAKEA